MTDRFEKAEDEIAIVRRRTHELSNAIAVEREERRSFQADLVGTSGNNGKLGTMRASLNLIRAALVAVALAALGGIGTAIAAVYSAGEERGNDRARLEAVERQVMTNTAAVQAATIYMEVLRLQGDRP